MACYEDEQKLLAEWAEWEAEAKRLKGTFKPKVVVGSFEAPAGYSAKLCFRKNSNAGSKWQEELARAMIVNTNTGVLVFEYGKWSAPRFVIQKLRQALGELRKIKGL